MRFRVQNIRKGYCEVWANERDGQRYQRLAVVMRDKSSNGRGYSWSWTASHEEPPSFLEVSTYKFDTRGECVEDFERTMLKRLVDQAIETQPEESQHWHSPRRDAWCTVSASHLFTQEELHEIKIRLMTFEEEQS